MSTAVWWSVKAVLTRREFTEPFFPRSPALAQIRTKFSLATFQYLLILVYLLYTYTVFDFDKE